MEQDGLDHAGEDLGHMNAHNLRDHLWEVDTGLQRLSLDEQIVGELVQLPHNLKQGKKKRKKNRAEKEQHLQTKQEMSNEMEAMGFDMRFNRRFER